jgi:hypothetical protein
MRMGEWMYIATFSWWSLVDPIADLDEVEKWKFWPHRDTNSDSSVAQPIASRHTDDYATVALKINNN